MGNNNEIKLNQKRDKTIKIRTKSIKSRYAR